MKTATISLQGAKVLLLVERRQDEHEIARFKVIRRDEGRQIGTVLAYRPYMYDGRAFIRVDLDDSVQGKIWPLETVALFLDYMFEHVDEVWVELLKDNEFNAAIGNGVIKNTRHVPIEEQGMQVIEGKITRQSWTESEYRRFWRRYMGDN